MTMFEKATAAVHDAVLESTKGLSLHPTTCAAAASAVLHAIREPDEAMRGAAEHVTDVYERGPAFLEVVGTWEAMIDAILEEKP